MKSPVSRKYRGFTLIELIVVITILAILGTIGFLSIGGYSSKARDSARVSDVAQAMKSLDLSVVTAGKYPLPDASFAVTYLGGTVWDQGTVGPLVMQYFKGSIPGGGINEKPVDPLKNSEYVYSSLAFGTAYQIKAEYENDLANATAYGDRGGVERIAGNPVLPVASAEAGNPTIAYIRGTYGWLVAKTFTGGKYYVLAIPSIITNSGTDLWGVLRIENNALSGTLLFNGKPLVNATTYNPRTKVVFSGSSLPADDSEGRITSMVTALRSAYGTQSDIASNSSIANLMSTSGSVAIVGLGTAIVSNQLWVKPLAGATGFSTYPGCDTADITLDNGQIWAACNAGATKAYTGATLTNCGGSATDCAIAYRDSIGGMYQWGRNDDISPKGTSTGVLAVAWTLPSTVGHPNFIQNNISPYDWIATRNDNLWGGATTSTGAGIYSGQTAPNQALMRWPCASGYHVPTIKEWCDAAASIDPAIACDGWWDNTSVASKLKLSLAGQRNYSNAWYDIQGGVGYYWTSSPTSIYSYYLYVSPIKVFPVGYFYRAYGYSVRCLKN